jgi:hypothetical protein
MAVVIMSAIFLAALRNADDTWATIAGAPLFQEQWIADRSNA